MLLKNFKQRLGKLKKGDSQDLVKQTTVASAETAESEFPSFLSSRNLKKYNLLKLHD